MILQVSIKAMNETINEEGLVKSRLVFGIIPRFPILILELQTQKERMDTIESSQAEMNTIFAEPKILSALNRNVAPCADQADKLEENV